MSKSELFLERECQQFLNPPTHHLVLRLPPMSQDEARTWIATLQPEPIWRGRFGQASFALDEQGYGLRTAVCQVGATPGDAVDRHFTLQLPELSLNLKVGEGYQQDSVLLKAEARAEAQLIALRESHPEAPARHLTFEEATAQDTPAVAALIESIFVQDYDLIFDPGFDTPDIAGADQFWILSERKEVRACCALWLNPDFGELKTLYVHSCLRRLGWGSRLTRMVIDRTRRCARDRVKLWSDTRFTDAHKLYKRQGFRQLGKRSLSDVNQSEEYGFELLI